MKILRQWPWTHNALITTLVSLWVIAMPAWILAQEELPGAEPNQSEEPTITPAEDTDPESTQSVREAAIPDTITDTVTNTVAEIVETNAPVPPPPVEPMVSAERAWKSFMQLQGQMDTALLAIERSRREREIVEEQNQRQLEQRLKLIEQTIDDQRTQEAQAMREANHNMLMVAGLFAGVGFLAMVVTSILHFRSMSKLGGIIAALPFESNLSLGMGGSTNMTAAVDSSAAKLLAAQEDSERSGPRLLNAIERLEQRIHELEHTSQAHGDSPLASAPSSPTLGGNGHAKHPDAAPPNEFLNSESRIDMVLGKGQTLLNLGQAEEAILCFDEVLLCEPANADAWVKKGSAMEKLNRLTEAIACYDKAISANSEMTLAYLYKGGVYNRMERYNEALACYEKALHTQKPAAPKMAEVSPEQTPQ